MARKWTEDSREMAPELKAVKERNDSGQEFKSRKQAVVSDPLDRRPKGVKAPTRAKPQR